MKRNLTVVLIVVVGAALLGFGAGVQMEKRASAERLAVQTSEYFEDDLAMQIVGAELDIDTAIAIVAGVEAEDEGELLAIACTLLEFALLNIEPSTFGSHINDASLTSYKAGKEIYQRLHSENRCLTRQGSKGASRRDALPRASA